MTLHPTRSRIGSLSAFVGDDAFISAQGDTSSPFSTDVYLRDADHDPLTTLHLSPTAVRELRDALTRSLMALESATIAAAGLEVDIPVSA